jgi:hypothetical protein
LLWCALAASAPAAVPEGESTTTASEVLEQYRNLTSTGSRTGSCPAPTAPDEIVVCGASRSGKYRIQRAAGDAPQARGSDVHAERAALEHAGRPCAGGGHAGAGCGGLDVIAIGRALITAAGKIVGDR